MNEGRNETFREQLIKESEAMAKYASSAGLRVDSVLLVELDRFLSPDNYTDVTHVPMPIVQPVIPDEIPTTIDAIPEIEEPFMGEEEEEEEDVVIPRGGEVEEFNEEKYSLPKSKDAIGNAGPIVIPEVNMNIPTEMNIPNSYDQLAREKFDTKVLIKIHQELTTIVSPAKPGTIRMLQDNAAKDGQWTSFGKVSLSRRMLAVALLLLIALLGLSALPEVNGALINISFMEHKELYGAILKLCLLVSAAGVGASFAALFKANTYIENGTYNPEYESTYWGELVLGVMAGVLLSEVLPTNLLDDPGFGKVVLAVLGGFSSSVVYRFLLRLVYTLESALKGDNKKEVQDQVAKAKNTSKDDVKEAKFQLARQLTNLQTKVTKGASEEILGEEINNILENLMPSETIYDELSKVREYQQELGNREDFPPAVG